MDAGQGFAVRAALVDHETGDCGIVLNAQEHHPAVCRDRDLARRVVQHIAGERRSLDQGIGADRHVLKIQAAVALGIALGDDAAAGVLQDEMHPGQRLIGFGVDFGDDDAAPAAAVADGDSCNLTVFCDGRRMIARIQDEAGKRRGLLVVVRPRRQIGERDDAAAVRLAGALQDGVAVVELKADAGERIARVVGFRDLNAAGLGRGRGRCNGRVCFQIVVGVFQHISDDTLLVGLRGRPEEQLCFGSAVGPVGAERIAAVLVARRHLDGQRLAAVAGVAGDNGAAGQTVSDAVGV